MIFCARWLCSVVYYSYYSLNPTYIRFESFFLRVVYELGLLSVVYNSCAFMFFSFMCISFIAWLYL